ncbi:hypothetical protein C4Q28_23275 [Pseudomonas sp. SWI6]|nr:hypothetical protein C4Q28_23265 [Pseudomonas sp. SWI6]AVD84883.1 hypothetical protein C4Q28_23275 [Pseudomonas sp. SWI6]
MLAMRRAGGARSHRRQTCYVRPLRTVNLPGNTSPELARKLGVSRKCLGIPRRKSNATSDS